LRKRDVTLNIHDSIVLVFLIWLTICVAGAVPFFLSGTIPNFFNALFESSSGFTTTGASVIADAEGVTKSIQFWRMLTHWLGGVGVVVFTVAIFPLLGVDGYSMVNAEATGPDVEKISPRLSDTAKMLVALYVGLTFLQTLTLKIFGMNFFDALLNSFSTIGTGGFSTRNSSIASYNSPAFDWICTVFMLIAGFNFTLIFRLLQGRPGEIKRNTEAKAYGLIIVIAIGLVFASLVIQGGFDASGALRRASFQTASVLTTTGFSISDMSVWPPLARSVIFFLMCIGGCTGSTAGGVKILRYVIFWKQMRNESKKMLYPTGVFSIHLDSKPGNKKVLYGVAGFIFFYFFLIGVSTVLCTLYGIEVFPAINLSLLTLGSIGLSLGPECSANFLANLPVFLKLWFCFIMIAGRLELWTAFVIFTGRRR
jgi:trk system potassium uptake protein TrkH